MKYKARSIDDIDRMLRLRSIIQLQIEYYRNRPGRDDKLARLVVGLAETDCMIEKQIPHEFTSQIPKCLPMKEVKLYTDMPKNSQGIRSLFKYLSQKGYRLVLAGIEAMKPKQPVNNKPKHDAVMLEAYITHEHLGVNESYFDRHLKDRWLDVMMRYMDGKIQVMDNYGTIFYVHKSWVKR